MKSHERLKAERLAESQIEKSLSEQGWIDENGILRSWAGDFLIEVKAHYLGSKSRRLTEPADDVVD